MSNFMKSNRLTVLAGRVRDGYAKGKKTSVEAAEHFLEVGRTLIEAKAECQHGQWGIFLTRAGIHERQARRLMQLARSGLKSDTVSEMGIKGALKSIAKQKNVTEGEEQNTRTRQEWAAIINADLAKADEHLQAAVNHAAARRAALNAAGIDNQRIKAALIADMENDEASVDQALQLLDNGADIEALAEEFLHHLEAQLDSSAPRGTA